MEIVGYLAAVLIGLTLGVIGGGGSILTVPVLVYLLGVRPVEATSMSLFVVGFTALLGAVGYRKKNLVDLRTAVGFGIPSIVAVWLTRMFLIPVIPQEVFTNGNLTVTKSMLLMLLFAVLMIGSAYSMIKKQANTSPKPSGHRRSYVLVLAEGAAVGTLTGLVGAGGGFLIIPALVLLGGLEMKMAVGTSLLIIAAKSLIGFTGDLGHMPLNWALLVTVTVLSLVGMLIGQRLSDKVSGEKLKPAFGWFTLAMGVFIVIKETMMR